MKIVLIQCTIDTNLSNKTLDQLIFSGFMLSFLLFFISAIFLFLNKNKVSIISKVLLFGSIIIGSLSISFNNIYKFYLQDPYILVFNEGMIINNKYNELKEKHDQTINSINKDVKDSNNKYQLYDTKIKNAMKDLEDIQNSMDGNLLYDGKETVTLDNYFKAIDLIDNVEKILKIKIDLTEQENNLKKALFDIIQINKNYNLKIKEILEKIKIPFQILKLYENNSIFELMPFNEDSSSIISQWINDYEIIHKIKDINLKIYFSKIDKKIKSDVLIDLDLLNKNLLNNTINNINEINDSSQLFSLLSDNIYNIFYQWVSIGSAFNVVRSTMNNFQRIIPIKTQTSNQYFFSSQDDENSLNKLSTTVIYDKNAFINIDNFYNEEIYNSTQDIIYNFNNNFMKIFTNRLFITTNNNLIIIDFYGFMPKYIFVISVEDRNMYDKTKKKFLIIKKYLNLNFKRIIDSDLITLSDEDFLKYKASDLNNIEDSTLKKVVIRYLDALITQSLNKLKNENIKVNLAFNKIASENYWNVNSFVIEFNEKNIVDLYDKTGFKIYIGIDHYSLYDIDKKICIKKSFYNSNEFFFEIIINNNFRILKYDISKYELLIKNGNITSYTKDDIFFLSSPSLDWNRFS